MASRKLPGVAYQRSVSEMDGILLPVLLAGLAAMLCYATVAWLWCYPAATYDVLRHATVVVAPVTSYACMCTTVRVDICTLCSSKPSTR